MLGDESSEGDTVVDPIALFVLTAEAIGLDVDVVVVVELFVFTDDVGLADDVSGSVESNDAVPQLLACALPLARLSDAECDCVTTRTEYVCFGDCVAPSKSVIAAEDVLRADRLTEADLETDIDELALTLVRTLREARPDVV